MNRKIFCFALSALFLAFTFPAAGQQPAKISRIGYLAGGASSVPAAFVRGLRDLGYFERKNIVIEFLTNEGKSGRSSDLAAELISLKMDILVTEDTGSMAPIITIGIVLVSFLAASVDTVATGLVDSLARPGGNVTGLTLKRRCCCRLHERWLRPIQTVLTI